MRNPLVAAGLIPEYLQDILVADDKQPAKKRKTRVITKARVITGDEYIKELKEAQEKKKEAEEQRKDRRFEAAIRKVEKEMEKERPRRLKRNRPRTKKTNSNSQPSTSLTRSTRSTRSSHQTQVTLAESEDSDSDSDTSDSDEDDEACFKCGYHDPPESADEEIGADYTWNQCDNDNCERWYHDVCLDPEEKPTQGTEWNCPICILNKSD